MNLICIPSILAILFIPSQSAHRTYQFQAYVSLLPWSGTVDEIYFRLCNVYNTCGLFQSVAAGWQSRGETYSYNYITNEDIGDIYKVQIVHPGSDMLCIGHIEVNGIEYDENEFEWWDWPHCIEEADGGGCDTVTIILPDNDWHSVLTIPCEFEHELDGTYSPIKSPSQSPIIQPSINPSKYPTISPTHNPSVQPSVAPTVETVTTNQNENENANRGGNVLPTKSINSDSALGNSDMNNNGNIHSNSAIIGGLIALVLCLCLIIITLICCWRKKRNMNDNVREVNGKIICAQSTISSDDGVLEGVVTTQIGSTNANVKMLNGNKQNNKYAKVQLIGDNSSDDNDEGLYDNQMRNVTERIILDDNQNSDMDDDILPK